MMKYNGKAIQSILMGVSSTMKQQAESYLNSDKVRSVKYCYDEVEPNEFEAFIVENDEIILMPGVEVDKRFRVQDIHCQCSADDELCVHEVALLMAAQFMMEQNNSTDYHSAKKAMALQSMESTMLH